MLKKFFSAKWFYISILFAVLLFLVLQVYAIHRSRMAYFRMLTAVISRVQSGTMPDDVLGVGDIENGRVRVRWGILPKFDANDRKDRVMSDGAGVLVISDGQALYFANDSEFGRINRSYHFQIFLSVLFCVVVMWFSLLFYFVFHRSLRKLERWVKGYSEKTKRKKKISSHRIPIQGFSELISGIEKIYSDLINTEKAVERKTKLEALGVLFAKVLHDIKNGLASIKIYQYLLRGEKDEGKRKELMRKTEDGISDVTAMIQDLLDFVRGNKETLKESMRVKDLYHGLKTEYEAKAKVEGVKFDISMVEDIAERTIQVELVRIITGLKHLIQNAFEEVENAGIPDPEVHIRLKNRKDSLLIEIADNGRGIPDELTDEIFTPFVSKGKASGNGIGAAVSKEYIEAQNGHIEFTTSPGGTTFRVTIPFSKTQPK